MIKHYICPIVGTGKEGDSYRASVYGVARSFVTDIPVDPITGKPLFALCVIAVAGDHETHEMVKILNGVAELASLSHAEFHAKLAEGRERVFAVRQFPDTADPDARLDQAIQQQHRSAQGKNLRIAE